MRLPVCRAALGALAVLLMGLSATAQERVAQLTQVDGKVTITRANASKVDEARQLGPRVQNGSVFPGDVVATGPASTAVIAFSDETKVTLKENTMLTVKETDLSALVAQGRAKKPIGRTVRVLAGDILASVVPNPEVATDFETPSGVAAVKGTEFQISVRSQEDE